MTLLKNKHLNHVRIYNPYSEGDVNKIWKLNKAVSWSELSKRSCLIEIGTTGSSVNGENISDDDLVILIGPRESLLCHTNEFIGQCGLLVQTVDGIKELEIGYSILPQFWKQGYATEAAKKCSIFAKENDFVQSLISIIHIDNLPSQKVALKNGMHLDKTTVYDNNPVHIFRKHL